MKSECTFTCRRRPSSCIVPLVSRSVLHVGTAENAMLHKVERAASLLSVQFHVGTFQRHSGSEGEWQTAYNVFDMSGNVAEAKLAARMFWECPFTSVREQVLASLCQALPAEAFRCGVKMAAQQQLSHGCLRSLLTALVRLAQDGKLQLHMVTPTTNHLVSLSKSEGIWIGCDTSVCLHVMLS